MRLLAPILTSSLLALSSGCSENVHAPSPKSFPLSVTERMASEGLDGRVLLLRQDVATVASGNERLAVAIGQIAEAYGQILARRYELAQEASRVHGVAVVQSGSSWVEVGR